jgi:hypothetical protein
MEYAFAYEQPDDASLESEMIGIKPEFFSMLDTPPTGHIGADTLRYRPTDVGIYETGSVQPPGKTILAGAGVMTTLLLIAGGFVLLKLLGML